MAKATLDAGKSKAKYTSPDAARKGAAGVKPKATAPAKVKVSQGTIDTIKSMGMKKALSMLPDYNNKAVRNLPGNKEYVEGVRRMYGDRRFQDAMRNSTPVAPKYKSPDAARRSAK